MSAPIKQDAAFRWTESGQDYLHYLGAKIRRPTVNPVQQVHRWRSADLTTERVISIGSGVHDLSGTLRFDGSPDSLARFVAAGRRGASLEYFPSLAAPSLSFPCVLVEAGEITTDPDLWFDRRHQVDVRLRRIDGGSWQALLEAPFFYWRAGNLPPGLSFTRAGATATEIDEFGILSTVAANILRTDHLDLDGDGIREDVAVPLEAGSENLVLQSENFGTTWSAVGTPTRSAAAHTGSGVTLDLIGDDSAAAVEYYEQIIGFTGDGDKAFSIFVKEGDTPPPAGSTFLVRDTDASVTRGRGIITFTDGVPSVAMSAGVEVFDPEALADGVYRLRLRAAGVVAANVNRVRVVPGRDSDVTDTGDIYVGGVQCEDGKVPTSYVKTTTATVERGSELFRVEDVAFAPQSIVAAGGATLYAKWVERGTAFLGADAFYWLAGSNVRLLLYSPPTDGALNAQFRDGTSSFTSTALGAVTLGSEMEARVVIFLDGGVWKIQLHYSVNGAAEVSAAAVTIGASLPAAWDVPDVTINSTNGGSNVGICHHLAHKFMPGVLSLAAMRAA